jgi:hypothetical protein
MLRGGYLYYFNATTKNDNDNYIINQKIINTTKYRGVGIDIRCGQSGYAVTPGSRVYNKETKQIGFCNIEKDLPIIDVPSSLISWLTAFVPDKKTTTEKKEGKLYTVNSEYTYEMTDKEFQGAGYPG